MTPRERIKYDFIRERIQAAREGAYPVVEPAPADNERPFEWWLPVFDAKAFLFSINGSAAWLFPHYELRLAPLEARVVVRAGSVTLVDSTACLEFRETAHAPQIYIPKSEIDMSYLEKTETVTYCPFKNLADHYRVRTPDGVIEDAFWEYDEVYERFPASGNAADVTKLPGLLAPYREKLDVKVV